MTEEVKEDFDIEDLRYYATLTPKQKLDYLEEMNLFCLRSHQLRLFERIKN